MRGIILGVNLHDYRNELQEGELVFIDNIYYKLEKIDKRWNKLDHEEDNHICYFVRSKINDELMNFERKEISKASISIFDSERYFLDGKRIKLGNISNENLRNIKAKALLDWDMPLSQLDNVHDVDLLELEFDGYVTEMDVEDQEGVLSIVKYFKLN